MNYLQSVFLFAIALTVGIAGPSYADITNFTTWTLVEDPADPSLSGSANSAQAILIAGNGNVPLATDIGFQSVNGPTPGLSTMGNAFSPNSNFSIAIDYNLVFSGNPAGNLALGFGIGEDNDGKNSVGVAMGTSNGVPLGTFAGGARVNDIDQGPKFTVLPSTLAGSLFVSYVAASGNVTFGASQSPAAAAPTVFDTYAGIQNQWTDSNLLVSFFIRSGPLQPWLGGGTGSATFTNFRVLSGSAIAVPEPTSLVVLLLGIAGLGTICRRI